MFCCFINWYLIGLALTPAACWHGRQPPGRWGRWGGQFQSVWDTLQEIKFWHINLNTRDRSKSFKKASGHKVSLLWLCQESSKARYLLRMYEYVTWVNEKCLQPLVKFLRHSWPLQVFTGRRADIPHKQHIRVGSFCRLLITSACPIENSPSRKPCTFSA